MHRAWRLRISGFDDPDPVFVASRAASTKADIGPRAVISDVGVARAGQDVDVPGRYRGDATEHRIRHSPVRGQRVVAGSMSRATLSVPSVGQPSNPPAADY
jgi:hypothetical protein